MLLNELLSVDVIPQLIKEKNSKILNSLMN